MRRGQRRWRCSFMPAAGTDECVHTRALQVHEFEMAAAAQGPTLFPGPTLLLCAPRWSLLCARESKIRKPLAGCAPRRQSGSAPPPGSCGAAER